MRLALFPLLSATTSPLMSLRSTRATRALAKPADEVIGAFAFGATGGSSAKSRNRGRNGIAASAAEPDEHADAAASPSPPPSSSKKTLSPSGKKRAAKEPSPPPPSGKKRAAKEPSPPPPSSKKRASSPTLSLEPPEGWRETYDLVTELRADRTAVVDTMGCEAINESAEPDTRAYQTLISLMLSSQTKDTVNFATMEKLRAHGLSVANILATPDDELHALIKAVGFHNNKLRYIKQATQILHDEHEGRVPETMDALLALPGVGPKMALITLHVAFGKVEGISVDTHVHRICNQLGWAGEGGTKQPEATRKAIEAWMPRDVWPDVNVLLVGLGQEVQMEKGKLLGKAVACSDPLSALRLLETLGVPTEKGLKAAKLAPPDGYVPGEGLPPATPRAREGVTVD